MEKPKIMAHFMNYRAGFIVSADIAIADSKTYYITKDPVISRHATSWYLRIAQGPCVIRNIADPNIDIRIWIPYIGTAESRALDRVYHVVGIARSATHNSFYSVGKRSRS